MAKNSKVWAWWSMLVFSLVLSGCGGAAEESPYAAGDLNQVAGLTMETKESRYPVGVEEVDLIIKNDTDEEFYYGVPFSVEKMAGERWIIVPFEEDVAWIEIALIMSPKSQNEEKVSFELLRDDLTAGTYRIIKEIGGEPFSAEFEITETE